MPATAFPSMLVVALSATLLACAPAGRRPNQEQGAISPSGRYVVRVPIEAQTTDPRYAGTRVWKVTISDRSDRVLYRDEGSTMVGRLNVYWAWDGRDRLWLYNSDDGKLWRWEATREGWKKDEVQASDDVPESLLPVVAR